LRQTTTGKSAASFADSQRDIYLVPGYEISAFQHTTVAHIAPYTNANIYGCNTKRYNI